MILVTGASGNVGKEVLKQISQTGIRVRATFQSPSSGASAPSGVEIAIMDYIKTTGVAYTFLRPNGFMQNIVNYNATTINAQNAFYGCQGESKISHIDIRDVAAVATKALTENGHEGKVYTLTGPVALSNAQI